METSAINQLRKMLGATMAVLGSLVLVAAFPFSIFALLNFENLPGLFYLVPVGMGLGGIASIVAGFRQFTGCAKFDRVVETETFEREMARSVEDRLDELERLKRRDMVTPEEYAAKRQEILKDL
jgi:hypothetical protein